MSDQILNNEEELEQPARAPDSSEQRTIGGAGVTLAVMGLIDVLAACRRERRRDVASYKASAHVIEGTRREERAERDRRQNSVGDDARSRVGSMLSLAG